MFYFITNVILYSILIVILYHYLNYKHFNILNLAILMSCLNIYGILIYKDINVIIGIIITFLIVLVFSFYSFFYKVKNKEIKNNNIFINRGIINFRALLDNNYSYKRLIDNLSKKGFKRIEDIDYCMIYNNELLVYKGEINSFPIGLIIDGKIINDNLKSIKKSREWLIDSIQNENIELKNINYAFVRNDKIYFVLNT